MTERERINLTFIGCIRLKKDILFKLVDDYSKAIRNKYFAEQKLNSNDFKPRRTKTGKRITIEFQRYKCRETIERAEYLINDCESSLKSTSFRKFMEPWNMDLVLDEIHALDPRNVSRRKESSHALRVNTR